MRRSPKHPISAIRRCRKASKRRSAGFTLIEAALTTVIVGTGVLAIVAAQQAYHMKNDWAQRTGTAQYLANELRELTLTMPMHDPISGEAHLGPESDEFSVADYDDLDDFVGTIDSSGQGSGTTFEPPIDALREEIPDMENWRQVVEVENVLPDNISATFTQPVGTTDVVRITVKAQYKDPSKKPLQYRTVTQLTWVVSK